MSTDIYLLPVRGLEPQKDTIGDVSVRQGHYLGSGTADVAGEAKIGYIRLQVAGERDPLIVYIAYPLTVALNGHAVTWACSPRPRVAATALSCEGEAYDVPMADSLRVLVQRVDIGGSTVALTHQIEQLQANAP